MTLTHHDVEYTSDHKTFGGHVVYDSSTKGPCPAVLIVSDWMGLGPFAKQKAESLAQFGYVAFAADVYGKGANPANREEAAQLIEIYKSDRALLRTHIRAAYDQLITMPIVDASKVVVMGYCFGGTTALELARSGAPLVGTVSFHGGLFTPTPQDAKKIRGRVLALHGADDPSIPAEEVAAFKDEMSKAKVPLKFVAYPGAVHAFTNPELDTDNSQGAAYNEGADRKSWQECVTFLGETTR